MESSEYASSEDVMARGEERRESIDDLGVLLAALPPDIVKAVHELPDKEALIEVVLDLGRPPEARFPNSEVILLEREVSDRDIAYVVEHYFDDFDVRLIDPRPTSVVKPEVRIGDRLLYCCLCRRSPCCLS